VKAALSKIIYGHTTVHTYCRVRAIVYGRKILGQRETQGKLSQSISFKVNMSFKVETSRSEYEKASETDNFRTGDTAYKHKLTPHTRCKCINSADVVDFTATGLLASISNLRESWAILPQQVQQ